jgi:hypothetical protein
MNAPMETPTTRPMFDRVINSALVVARELFLGWRPTSIVLPTSRSAMEDADRIIPRAIPSEFGMKAKVNIIPVDASTATANGRLSLMFPSFPEVALARIANKLLVALNAP